MKSGFCQNIDSDGITNIIINNINDILNKMDNNDVYELYESSAKNIVFTLNKYPKYVCKMRVDKRNIVKNTYKSIEYIRDVIINNNLNLLKVPDLVLLDFSLGGKVHYVIVEEKMNVHPNHNMFELEYKIYGNRINNAIKQLTILTCITGYDDAAWRNNPILHANIDTQEDLLMALIDIEDVKLKNVRKGLGRIISCINENQISLVLTMVSSYYNNINLDEFIQKRISKLKE